MPRVEGVEICTSTIGSSVWIRIGVALDAESSGATNRRFTSYDRSPVTGLDYAINRHYDPLQGRFTQVDPIGMDSVDLTDPQTLNLYAYCANDPINQIDPDGLFFKKLFRWIGKALKWAAVGLLVAAAVATTLIVAAPVGSVLWKVWAWLLVKALPVAAKYLGYVGVGMPVGIGLGTPPWNPQAGGYGFGLQDQAGVPPGYEYKDGVLRRAGGGAVLQETVNVVERLPWYRRGIFGVLGDFSTAFADEITFGFTRWWEGREREANENSAAYRAGSWAGYAAGFILPGPGKLKVLAKGEKFFAGFKTGYGHSVRQIGRFTEFSVNVPGRVPGSYTRWVKVLNEHGRTIRLYHDTFDPAQRFVHRSIKVPGPPRHMR